MSGLFYKPFTKNTDSGKEKSLLESVTLSNKSSLLKELDETFTLIGEEFKSIKNCKLYNFFVNLSESEQNKIINFLKNILKDEHN